MKTLLSAILTALFLVSAGCSDSSSKSDCEKIGEIVYTCSEGEAGTVEEIAAGCEATVCETAPKADALNCILQYESCETLQNTMCNCLGDAGCGLPDFCMAALAQ